MFSGDSVLCATIVKPYRQPSPKYDFVIKPTTTLMTALMGWLVVIPQVRLRYQADNDRAAGKVIFAERLKRVVT